MSAVESPTAAAELVRALEAYTDNQRELLGYLRKQGVASQAVGALLELLVTELEDLRSPDVDARPTTVSESRVSSPRVPGPPPVAPPPVAPPALHSERSYDYFVELDEQIAATRPPR